MHRENKKGKDLNTQVMSLSGKGIRTKIGVIWIIERIAIKKIDKDEDLCHVDYRINGNQ